MGGLRRKSPRDSGVVFPKELALTGILDSDASRSFLLN